MAKQRTDEDIVTDAIAAWTLGTENIEWIRPTNVYDNRWRVDVFCRRDEGTLLIRNIEHSFFVHLVENEDGEKEVIDKTLGLVRPEDKVRDHFFR